MSERVKKPPISIDELEQKKPEDMKGTLSYVDKGPSGGQRSKINITQLVLAVGLSILIVFLISNYVFATKKDALTLLDNQRLLETKQSTLEGNLNTQTSRIENVISHQATQDTQIQGLSNSISDFLSRVTGTENRITSLENRIGNLEGKVEALGNQTVKVPFDYYFSNNKFYVKVEKGGNYRFRFTLFDKAGTSGFLTPLVYYTKNVHLEPSDSYISYGLKGLGEALKDGGYEDLSYYMIYVELLEGNEPLEAPKEENEL